METGTFGQAAGTLHVKYSPVVGIDVVVKGGSSQCVNIKHHCITCMKEYEKKSLEELRLEDYMAGKGPAGAGVFGFQQTERKPLFGGTSTFGQQQLETGTVHVKYSPVMDTEVDVTGGSSQSVNIKLHCITCMKEYETKALEELRLEDYMAGRKGFAIAEVFGFQQTERKPLFGGTSTFGQQQLETGTVHVKYSPVMDTEVDVTGGSSQSVNIKLHCITCMKEYEKKSLEELRLEDYMAGRKGFANAEVFGFQQTERKPLFGETSEYTGTD